MAVSRVAISTEGHLNCGYDATTQCQFLPATGIKY